MYVKIMTRGEECCCEYISGRPMLGRSHMAYE